jgi:DNA-binding NtrC family response regulator
LSRPLDEEERFSLPPPAQQGPISPATEGVNVEEEKARCELNCVRMALEACHYDKTRAAQWLGLKHREDLYRRVKKNFQKFPQLQEEFADVCEAFHL